MLRVNVMQIKNPLGAAAQDNAVFFLLKIPELLPTVGRIVALILFPNA